MTHRQLKALLRQPGVLVITLAQPMAWLLPGWMQAVAAANPVNWALDATRGALWLLALAALMVWLSTLTFRTYQRTV